MAVKLLSNAVLIGAATNVYLATAVLVTANGASDTVVVANTANHQNAADPGQHGVYAGGQVSVRIAPNSMTIIRKRPQDTVQAATGVYATKVAEGEG